MSDFFEQAMEMQKKETEKRMNIESKTSEELIDELDRAKTIKDSKRRAEELIKELYRKAIENIKISEWERIKINKNNFKDKNEVIDILLYIVGKMAQDPIFYKMNVKKLEGHKPIYQKEAE